MSTFGSARAQGAVAGFFKKQLSHARGDCDNVCTMYVPGADLWPNQGQNHRQWALQGRPQSLCVHCPRQSLPVLIASAPLIAPCKRFVTFNSNDRQ